MNVRPKSLARLPSSRFPDTFDHHTVRQGNGERDPIVGAEVSRDVALAGRIFNQVDVSGGRGDTDRNVPPVSRAIESIVRSAAMSTTAGVYRTGPSNP